MVASQGKIDLVPGTYPSSQYDPSSNHLRNLSISTTPQTFTLSPPLSPLTFDGKNYHDAQISLLEDWDSAYLPDGWYGTLIPGQAIWGAVADKKQLGGLPPKTQGFIEVAYGMCPSLSRWKVLGRSVDILDRPMRPAMWGWWNVHAWRYHGYLSV